MKSRCVFSVRAEEVDLLYFLFWALTDMKNRTTNIQQWIGYIFLSNLPLKFKAQPAQRNSTASMMLQGKNSA